MKRQATRVRSRQNHAFKSIFFQKSLNKFARFANNIRAKAHQHSQPKQRYSRHLRLGGAGALTVVATILLSATWVSSGYTPSTPTQDGWAPLTLMTPQELIELDLGIEEPLRISPNHVQSIAIKSGDSLSLVLSRAGLSNSTIHAIAYGTEHGRDISRLYPGKSIDVEVDDTGEFVRLKYAISDLEYFAVDQIDGELISRHETLSPYVYHHVTSGTIDSSFYLAGLNAGLSDGQIMELAGIFAWDIDFALSIRKGDSFSVIYEERYLEGESIGTGNILAAEFINQGKVFRAIRYEDSDGQIAYYSPAGENLKKAFLRTPLDVFRISSHFNLNRKHPVLNTIRAHKGTDYAAPTGTPVRAAGDGKVVSAGRNGGYGNLLVIQHGSTYETRYAHLNGFASGIRAGTRVQQGQIIGYVGMTGLATGPHLHYEFYVNGAVANPVTVSLPNGAPIDDSEKDRFVTATQGFVQLLDSPTLRYVSSENDTPADTGI